MFFYKILEKVNLLVVTLFFFTFLLTLPPLFWGIWVDSELIFSASIFIIGLACMVQVGRGFDELGLTLRQIRAFFFLLIPVVYGIAITPVANSTLFHFYGVPQTNEGIFSFGLLALGYLFFCVHQNKSSHRKFLLTIGALCIVTIAAFVFLNHPKFGYQIDKEWSIYVFTAFLAIPALSLAAQGNNVKNKILKVICFAISGCVLWISGNKSAWVICAIAVFLFLIIPNRIKESVAQKYKVLMLVFLSASQVLVIVACKYLPKINFNLFESLSQRSLQHQVFFVEFLEHPWNFITGYGYGYFLQAFLKNLVSIPVSLYQGDTFSPSWEGVWRVDFHSHNFLIEMFLSIGIIGALWVFVFPFIFVDFKKDKKWYYPFFFITIVMTILSTWFLTILQIPFLAWLLAAITHNNNDREYYLSNFQNWFGRIAILVVGIICLYASYDSFNISKCYSHTGSYFERLALRFTGPIDRDKYTKSYQWAEGFKRALKMNIRTSTPFGQDKNFIHMFELLKADKQSQLTHRLLALEAFTYIASFEGKKFNAQVWEDYLRETLNLAPQRYDLYVPYISHLILYNYFDKFENFIKTIPATHPVFNWFKGLALLKKTGSKKQAIPLIKNAIEDNVEKYLPVSDDVKRMVINFKG